MAKDVFISYKAEEYAEAAWVKSVLEENGYSCWLAPDSIPGGSSYADEIDAAIKDCAVFVLILSPKSQGSKWVKKELDIALNYGKVILPFEIETVQLQKAFNFYLTDVQRYTAFLDKSAAMKEMIKRIKSVVRGSASADDTVTISAFYEQDLIKKVMTVAGKDAYHPFPRGAYSSKIRIKRCKCVYFHIFLKAPIGKSGSISLSLPVYDDLGNLIGDLSDPEVACRPEYDKFSKGLIVRGDDGTSLQKGRYYADVSIDHCKPVRYSFQLL